MLDILAYDFMQKAFIVGILIAIMAPCIGIVMVLKRLSVVGDSLSHCSLAGVAAGLAGGFNPILGAVVFSVFAAIGMEKIGKAFPKYSELSTVIIMSTGVGLAGILSRFIKSSMDLNSFLFGSIVLIGNFEIMMVVSLSFVVISTVILLYKELFYITFDEESARLSGIPVGIINFIFTILTAITISISARTVGTLTISSLMVLPVACAMQVSKSYKQTLLYSIGFALFSVISGLVISYYADFRPGGSIVLVCVFILICILTYKGYFKKFIVQKSLKAEV